MSNLTKHLIKELLIAGILLSGLLLYGYFGR
nr:hypothetical protein [Mucilaginibacter sp. X5P1]